MKQGGAHHSEVTAATPKELTARDAVRSGDVLARARHLDSTQRAILLGEMSIG